MSAQHPVTGEGENKHFLLLAYFSNVFLEFYMLHWPSPF
jgi:hypothetical protein